MSVSAVSVRATWIVWVLEFEKGRNVHTKRGTKANCMTSLKIFSNETGKTGSVVCSRQFIMTVYFADLRYGKKYIESSMRHKQCFS